MNKLIYTFNPQIFIVFICLWVYSCEDIFQIKNRSHKNNQIPNKNLEEEERIAKEKERKINGQGEQDKKTKEEQDKKTKEEQDKKTKEEQDKKAKEEQDKKAKEEQDKKAKEEQDKKAKEEQDKKAKEEQERLEIEEEEEVKKTMNSIIFERYFNIGMLGTGANWDNIDDDMHIAYRAGKRRKNNIEKQALKDFTKKLNSMKSSYNSTTGKYLLRTLNDLNDLRSSVEKNKYANIQEQKQYSDAFANYIHNMLERKFKN